jgi:perosamine synthetase
VRGAGQYNQYGQAAHARHPAASDGRLLRSPAPPGVSSSRPGTAARTIPLSRPYLGESEAREVLEVLRSRHLSLGPVVPRFEGMFAERVGAPYAAAVSSGTSGLHLACRIAGIGPDDEVITSPYSFVASANCFMYEGAHPVFADIDAGTFNLDPAAVEAAVTPKTRAIMAVDIFGYPCELDELRAIADRHGLAFIEDSCEALGAEYKGRKIGSHGHMAVFAFYPNKQMTTGEGGIVATGSAEELELLVSLRNQGRADTDGWLDHSRFGFNYRLSDIHAAIGVAQLERLDEILAMRAAAAERYARLLDGVDGVSTLLADDANHRRSWFVYVVKLASGIDRDRVITVLEDQGIQSRPYLPCIHLQTYMRERYGFREWMFPVAEETSRKTLALPFHSAIDPEDQERVVDALRSAIA